MTATPSAAGRAGAHAERPSDTRRRRAPGARIGASTSGAVFARTPRPTRRQPHEPEDDVPRSPVGDQRRDRERHEETDLDVAVPVLADEDDRDGIERDAREERPPNGSRSAPTRDERQVQGHDEERLDEDEVERGAPTRTRRRRDSRGSRRHDDDEPERRPVQDAGHVRVHALVLRREGAPPVVRRRASVRRRSRRRRLLSRARRRRARFEISYRAAHRRRAYKRRSGRLLSGAACFGGSGSRTSSSSARRSSRSRPA